MLKTKARLKKSVYPMKPVFQSSIPPENTDTLSFAGKNDMKYQFNEKWTGSWVVGAIYNETDNKKGNRKIFHGLSGGTIS
jgi:hypothetical protein